ncbi:hypothetical protein ABTJ61_19465, partial [Acinetobacter baumannii]
MSASRPYTLQRSIPEDEVCKRATARLDEFVEAGGEPAGLDYRDFMNEVVEMWVDDLVRHALERGIEPGTPHWHLTPLGHAS